MPGAVRIGISGWTYAPWRGDFYPRGLRQRDELSYAAERLTSIEVNGTFYALQRPDSFRAWRDATPDDFLLAVKGGRFVTHMKRLVDVDTPLANFFASGLLALGPKLGPVLWQLPPNLAFDADVVDAFLGRLPRSTGEASRLARRHDERVTGRAVLTPDADRPVRHALEVRHESFKDPAFLELARRHGVAVVVADAAGRFPEIDEVTTDFVYVRLHGHEELYSSGYSARALDEWAARVQAWVARDLDVHVYFDNDMKVRAPYDAMALIERLADLGASPPSLTERDET